MPFLKIDQLILIFFFLILIHVKQKTIHFMVLLGVLEFYIFKINTVDITEIRMKKVFFLLLIQFTRKTIHFMVLSDLTILLSL